MARPGRHFLQIPGPTNTPDRVLRAMAAPTIDHRSAEFAALGRLCETRLPVLAGVAAVESVRQAEFLASEVTGVRMPPGLIDRLRSAAARAVWRDEADTERGCRRVPRSPVGMRAG